MTVRPLVMRNNQEAVPQKMHEYWEGWTLIDTRSKTGTFVNGIRIDKKTILENGDKLTFGNASYRFQL